MSRSIRLRHAIEDRPVIVGDNEHQLELMNVTEHEDGGTMATIAIAGAAEPVQMSLSDELLGDPIALRLRVVYFVRHLVSHKPTTKIYD